MAEIQTITKRHDTIKVGDVIEGGSGGWWQVKKVTTQTDGFREFDAVNVDTRDAGYLSGPANQVRNVRV